MEARRRFVLGLIPQFRFDLLLLLICTYITGDDLDDRLDRLATRGISYSMMSYQLSGLGLLSTQIRS